MKFGISALALTALLATAACAADPTAGPAGDVEASSDELVNPNFGYFIVTRPDMRKCASPMCGGFYVKRVNQDETRCADGKESAECYVAEIDLSKLGLSPTEESNFRNQLEIGHALVRGLTYKFQSGNTTLGRLKVNEAWRGASGATADGTFYRGADNGIRCIAAPCPSLGLSELNGHEDHNVTRVELGYTNPKASGADIAAGTAALSTKTGILFAGNVLYPKCLPKPGSTCGPLSTATEFYLPVKHEESKAGTICGTRGAAPCDGNFYCKWEAKDICGAADAPGVCTVRPDICPMIYNPVCACDGTTYSNSCTAAAAGASVISNGACKP